MEQKPGSAINLALIILIGFSVILGIAYFVNCMGWNKAPIETMDV